LYEKIFGKVLTTALKTGPGEEIRRAPVAAPNMITTSAGWKSTCKFPCSRRYPPTTDTRTTTHPIIANNAYLLIS
jgi:hypothetical protein